MKNYFTISEMCESLTARKNYIDNSPTPDVEENLHELIDKILNPLREAWGSAIIVTSGYRCPALNTVVRGSKTSAHNMGYAADLVPTKGKMSSFKAFVKKWLKDNKVAFDQYIDEHSGKSEWVHIGIRNAAGLQRRQYLLYMNGKYSVSE